MLLSQCGARAARFCLAACFGAGVAVAAVEPPTLSLSGTWAFALDPDKTRTPASPLPQSIRLPGTTDQAGLGVPNREPPTLDGLYRLNRYEGRAWYEREVEIPEAWRGKHVTLFLERAHWVTEAWLDGRRLGSRDSLIAPHVYDLGTGVTPGRHRLRISVDNTKKIDLGRFVSIHYEGTQTNWNGLIGTLELRASDPVAAADVQVYPDVARKQVRARVTVANHTGQPASGRIELSVIGVRAARRSLEFHAAERTATVETTVPMGPDARLWDEFSPSLYELKTALVSGGHNDVRTVTFGMREFAARGTQFTMNGRPLYLRGTLECAIFPRTGYPPTDVASWRRVYRIIKSYGLNHMRFHSWCPPEAAFTAADIEGVMIQAEGPQANVPAGRDARRDAFIEQEFLRIVRTYGNHPSFCLMTLGNEYGGPAEVLSRWVGMLRGEDPRHLYSSASSAQTAANRQFTVGGPRGVRGPGTAHDFRDAMARQDRPLVGHEIGQWTFFPNFGEIPKYDGVLAARNFALVRDSLAARHMLDLAPRFVEATGHHAALLYKEEIEVLLRTHGHAGFALLDLHDYPGQGTALVGLLDPFWDSKGFITPEQHRRYCGPTVPLLRLKKRTFTVAETLTADAEVAHFGPRDLAGARPRFSIRDARGGEIAGGRLPALQVPTGKVTPLGAITASLAKAAAPARLTVELAIEDTEFANTWEIWVYPAAGVPPAPPGVVVSRAWDDATKSALAAGRAVALFPRAVSLTQSLTGRFLPVFWSPVWFPTQRPNTMGILCDPRHPLFASFPTDMHSNWQWWELLQDSRSLILDDTPPPFRPLVQVIDNFARNHKLGNLFEARVGPGRLLVCTMNLPDLAGGYPAARQLLGGIYGYVGSSAFRPAQELEAALLDRLLVPSAAEVMHRLGARVVRVDSEQERHAAANLLDGDPATMWHTSWEDVPPPFPHEVVIAFRQPVRAAGVRCLPRQDRNRNGMVKDYEVYTSGDGVSWSLAARGSFDRTPEEKTVRFETPRTAGYLKLVALSGFDERPYASLAELTIIESQ